MSNLLVRIAVVALATTGFAASTVASKSSKQIIKPVTVAAGTSWPSCGPKTPCGID